MIANFNIAVEVRNARRKRKWSQEKLAEEAGVSKQTIVNLEKKHHSPSYDTIIRVIEVLDIDVKITLEGS